MLSDPRLVRSAAVTAWFMLSSTFSNLLLRSLRACALSSGILAGASPRNRAWIGGTCFQSQAAQLEFRAKFAVFRKLPSKVPSLFATNFQCKIEMFSRKSWFDDLSERIGSPLFAHHERPASPLPNGAGPVRS
jgi:hypothetical protein